MTNENAVNQLVRNIDNLIEYNLYRYYKRLDENKHDAKWFDLYCGVVDAWYQFAYSIIDDTFNSVADAIFLLEDDLQYYKDKPTYFAMGYRRAINKIFEILAKYGLEYEQSSDEPIENVYDTIYIDSFNI